MTQSNKLQDLQKTWTRGAIARETGIHLCKLERLYNYAEKLSEKDAAKLDRLHELEFGGEE